MTDISKIDMERINGLLDKLNEVTNKINSMKYVIETGNNDNGWYRKWSDGWIEQGGAITNLTTNTTQNLPISFTTTDYICLLTRHRNSGETTHNDAVVREKNLSFIRVNCVSTNNINIQWYACGY